MNTFANKRETIFQSLIISSVANDNGYGGNKNMIIIILIMATK